MEENKQIMDYDLNENSDLNQDQVEGTQVNPHVENQENIVQSPNHVNQKQIIQNYQQITPPDSPMHQPINISPNQSPNSPDHQEEIQEAQEKKKIKIEANSLKIQIQKIILQEDFKTKSQLLKKKLIDNTDRMQKRMNLLAQRDKKRGTFSETINKSQSTGYTLRLGGLQNQILELRRELEKAKGTVNLQKVYLKDRRKKMKTLNIQTQQIHESSAKNKETTQKRKEKIYKSHKTKSPQIATKETHQIQIKKRKVRRSGSSNPNLFVRKKQHVKLKPQRQSSTSKSPPKKHSESPQQKLYKRHMKKNSLRSRNKFYKPTLGHTQIKQVKANQADKLEQIKIIKSKKDTKIMPTPPRAKDIPDKPTNKIQPQFQVNQYLKKVHQLDQNLISQQQQFLTQQQQTSQHPTPEKVQEIYQPTVQQQFQYQQANTALLEAQKVLAKLMNSSSSKSSHKSSPYRSSYKSSYKSSHSSPMQSPFVLTPSKKEEVVYGQHYQTLQPTIFQTQVEQRSTNQPPVQFRQTLQYQTQGGFTQPFQIPYQQNIQTNTFSHQNQNQQQPITLSPPRMENQQKIVTPEKQRFVPQYQLLHNKPQVQHVIQQQPQMIQVPQQNQPSQHQQHQQQQMQFQQPQQPAYQPQFQVRLNQVQQPQNSKLNIVQSNNNDVPLSKIIKGFRTSKDFRKDQQPGEPQNSQPIQINSQPIQINPQPVQINPQTPNINPQPIQSNQQLPQINKQPIQIHPQPPQINPQALNPLQLMQSQIKQTTQVQNFSFQTTTPLKIIQQQNAMQNPFTDQQEFYQNRGQTPLHQNRQTEAVKLNSQQKTVEQEKQSRLYFQMSQQYDISQELDNKNDQFKYYMTKLQKYVLENQGKNYYFGEIYKIHFVQTFQALQLSNLVKEVGPEKAKSKGIILPPIDRSIKKKTIIFDLDETLIHCNLKKEKKCDVKLPMKQPSGKIIMANCNFRPFLIDSIKRLKKQCEVIILTSSHQSYADVILDFIDPQNTLFDGRFYRDHCVISHEKMFLKDLRIFCPERELKDMVLIDNAAYSFAFGEQLDNGIPIIPFYENKKDRELKELTDFIINEIVDAEDTREVLKNHFHHGIVSLNQTPMAALKEIYGKY